jgi:hypothetical protein
MELTRVKKEQANPLSQAYARKKLTPPAGPALANHWSRSKSDGLMPLLMVYFKEIERGLTWTGATELARNRREGSSSSLKCSLRANRPRPDESHAGPFGEPS